MANRSSSPAPQTLIVPPVFVDTNLDTHLAIPVSPLDTVADLKRKISIEHALCFPKVGEISIPSMKVRRRASFYHLSDSMLVRSAFDGIKGTWFLHADVVSKNGQNSQIERAETLMDMNLGLRDSHHSLEKENISTCLLVTGLDRLQGSAGNASTAENDLILTGSRVVSQRLVLPDALPHTSAVTFDPSLPNAGRMHILSLEKSSNDLFFPGDPLVLTSADADLGANDTGCELGKSLFKAEKMSDSIAQMGKPVNEGNEAVASDVQPQTDLATNQGEKVERDDKCSKSGAGASDEAAPVAAMKEGKSREMSEISESELLERSFEQPVKKKKKKCLMEADGSFEQPAASTITKANSTSAAYSTGKSQMDHTTPATDILDNHEYASSDGLTCNIPFADVLLPQIATNDKKGKKKRKRSTKSHKEVGSAEPSNTHGTDSFQEKEKVNSKLALSGEMSCMADAISPVESQVSKVESVEPLTSNFMSGDHPSNKDNPSHCSEEHVTEEKLKDPADVFHADLKESSAALLGSPEEVEVEAESPSKVRRNRKMHKTGIPRSKSSKNSSVSTLMKDVVEDNSEEASGNKQDDPSECHAGKNLKPSDLPEAQSEKCETAYPTGGQGIEQSLKESTAEHLEGQGEQSKGALDVGKPAVPGNLLVADSGIFSNGSRPKSRRSRKKSTKAELRNDEPTSKCDEDFIGKEIDEVKSKNEFGTNNMSPSSKSTFLEASSLETPAETESIALSGTRKPRGHKKKSAKTEVLRKMFENSDIVDHGGNQTTQETVSKELGSSGDDLTSKTEAQNNVSECHAEKNFKPSELPNAHSEKCEPAHPSGYQGHEKSVRETTADHLEGPGKQQKGALDVGKMATSGKHSMVGSGIPSSEDGPKSRRSRKKSTKAELVNDETTKKGDEDFHGRKITELKSKKSNHMSLNKESTVLEASSLENPAEAELISFHGMRRSRGQKKKSARTEGLQNTFLNNDLVDPAGNQTPKESTTKELGSMDEDLTNKTKGHILPDETGCSATHEEALKDSAFETVEIFSQEKAAALIDKGSQMEHGNLDNDKISFLEFFGPKMIQNESVKSAESGKPYKEKTKRKRKSNRPVEEFSSESLNPLISNEQILNKTKPLDTITANHGLGDSPGQVTRIEHDSREVDNESTLVMTHIAQKQLKDSADFSLEAIVDRAASSDSTEDISAQKRQYRVAVRKVRGKRSKNILGNSIPGSTILPTSGSIFNFDSGGSSQEESEMSNKKYTMKAATDASLPSPDSDAELEKAQGVDAAGDNSDTGVDDEGSILRQSSKNRRKRMPLSKILNSSSSDKRAKLTTSQSQTEDSGSQPVDVVFETQPELGLT